MTGHSFAAHQPGCALCVCGEWDHHLSAGNVDALGPTHHLPLRRLHEAVDMSASLHEPEPGHPRAVKGTIMRDDEAYEQCDEKPWMLFIDTPDGAHERRARSPEPLVAHAMKWAKDRGQYIELTIFGVKS